MNRPIFFLVILLFSAAESFAQIPRYNQPFIDHLMRHRLESDHLGYLNLMHENVGVDTVQYEQLRYDFHYHHHPSMLFNPADFTTLIQSDTCLSHTLFDEFMREGGETRMNWLEAYEWKSYSYETGSVLRIYSLILQDTSNFELPTELEPAYLSMQKYNRRKPIYAALLSTAIPGLGKVYAGRKHTFWGSFLMNAVFGLHAYDVYRGLGTKHWYTYFAGGSFGVFYLSNIVGSYIDVKRVRKEKKQVLINEALDYYIDCNLY